MDPVLSVRPSSKCPNTRRDTYSENILYILQQHVCLDLYVQISKMAADGHQRDDNLDKDLEVI